jgi:hypothetical protein
MYTAEMASCGMTYIPGFMKIRAGIQAIFGFCFNNLRVCIAGITERRDL